MTNDPSDTELLRAYFKQGEQGAVEVLFARHAGAAFRFAQSECGNATAAEEAVQTAFLQLIQGRNCEIANVRAWLLKVIVNFCYNQSREELRRRRREDVHVSIQQAPDSLDQAREEMTAAALRVIDALPDHYRLPVRLHYVEALTIHEVAATLSISENTVRSQVNRGIEHVRQALLSAGFACTLPALEALMHAVPPASAPAALMTTLKTMAAHGAHAWAGAGVSGATTATAASVKFAAAVLLIVVATVVVFNLPTRGQSAGNQSGDSAPEDSSDAVPDARLAEILKRKLNVIYRRDFLSDITDDLNRRAGLICILPAKIPDYGCYTDLKLGQDFTFSLEAKEIAVEEVLRQIAEAGHFEIEFHRDVVVLWKKAGDAVLTPLEKKIHAADPRQRTKAVCELAQLQDPRIYPLLFEALTDNDSRVAERALQDLRYHAETLIYGKNLDTAVTALLQLWNKQYANSAGGLTLAEHDLLALMAATRSPRIADALLPLLDKKIDSTRRQRISAVLRRINDPRIAEVASKAPNELEGLADLQILRYGLPDPKVQKAFWADAEKHILSFSPLEPCYFYRVDCQFENALDPRRDPRAAELLIQTYRGAADDQTRRNCLNLLAGAGSPKALEFLRSLLTDGKPEMRMAAALSLARAHVRDVPEVVEAVLELLGTDRAEDARVALMELSDSRAVEACIELAKDPAHKFHERAIMVLGRIGGPRATQALLGLLADPARCEETATFLSADPRSIDVLCAALKTGDAQQRDRVLSKLFPYECNVRLCQQYLNDPDANVRGSALESLARMNTPQALKVLAPRLNDLDPAVRAGTLDALANIYGTINPLILDDIIAMLNDPDDNVRISAIQVIGPAQREECLKRLSVQHRQKTNPVPFYHQPNQRDNIRTIRALVPLFNDANPRIADAAALTAGALEWSYTSDPADTKLALLLPFIQDPRETIRARGVTASGRMDRKSLETVVPLLNDPSQSVRDAAIYVLGSPWNESVQAVIPLLKSADLRTQKRVLEALCDSHQAEAEQAVADVVKNPDHPLRMTAFELLAAKLKSNHSGPIVAALTSGLKSNDPKKRELTDRLRQAMKQFIDNRASNPNAATLADAVMAALNQPDASPKPAEKPASPPSPIGPQEF